MDEISQYNSPGYTTFKMKLKKLIGIDLNSYKEQIHRRTHELMSRWGCKTYDDYYDMMNKDEKKLREFLDHLTINVSEFFRNDSQWWKLRDKIIPELIQKRKTKRLKLWSAGCPLGRLRTRHNEPGTRRRCRSGRKLNRSESELPKGSAAQRPERVSGKILHH